jgi:hypothetical protein
MKPNKKQEEELKPPQYIKSLKPETAEKPDSTIQQISLRKETSKIKKVRLFLRKKNQLRVIGFNMQLNNGDKVTILSFLEPNNSFIYLGRLYLWDNETAYYNKSFTISMNDYHQDCCIPITSKLLVNEIKEGVGATIGAEIQFALNPRVLWRFLQSSIQDLMLRGSVIWKALMQIRLLEFIILIMQIVMLFMLGYFMYHSGAFSSKKKAVAAPFALIYHLLNKNVARQHHGMA